MLHKNEIVGYKQLTNLTCLTRLHHLTLHGNPCSKIKGYRQLLVEAMPKLRSLDAFIVMDYERKDVATMFPPENIKKHKLLELNRFRPFNRDYNAWQPSRFIITDRSRKGSSMEADSPLVKPSSINRPISINKPSSYNKPSSVNKKSKIDSSSQGQDEEEIYH